MRDNDKLKVKGEEFPKTEKKEVNQEQVIVSTLSSQLKKGEKKNNKYILPIILLIVLSIIIIGVGLFFLLFRNDNHLEEEVVKILGKAYLGKTEYSSVLYNQVKYDYSKISDGAKFQTAVWSYDGKVEKREICLDGEKKSCYYDDVISFAQLKNNYFEIFGVNYNFNIKDYSDIKFNEIENKVFVPGTCPFIDKIDENDLYLSHRCGGTSSSGIYEDYVYDYEQDDSTVKVYVAVAYWAYNDNSSTAITIYKDYKHKKIYKKNITFKESIKLDKNNYNKFSKFKIIYKKNSLGKYIYKSSERISSGK